MKTRTEISKKKNVFEQLHELGYTFEQEPCGDLISRQAVQDYIAEYLSQYLYNDVREAVEVIDEYIGGLPSVTPQEPRWIPVSERLPEEEGKSVLVYAPEYNNIYCAYLESDTWFIFGGYGTYAVANVIAWMPLPEPYEPQESEEV